MQNITKSTFSNFNFVTGIFLVGTFCLFLHINLTQKKIVDVSKLLAEGCENLSDKRVKWDWRKLKIKTSSIAYSKKLSRDRKSKEEELNLKHQALLKIFQDNPCETTRLETEKVKSELEALYDKKSRGNYHTAQSKMARAR